MKKQRIALLLLFAFLFVFSFASAVQVRVQSDATHDAVYRSNCELQGTSYVTAMDGVCVGGEDVVLDLDPGQHIIRAYMDRGHDHPTGGIAIKITNLEGELEYRTDVDVSSDSLTTNPYWRACHGDNYCNLFNKPTIETFYNYGMVDIYEDNPVLISGADTVHYLADTRLNFISYIFTIPEEEIPEEVYQCSNSLDDDSDGLIDSADPGCWDDPMDSSSYNPTDDDEGSYNYTNNTETDYDGDGYNNSVDCNDHDALINPGALEICDGVDNDCDGIIDEGCGGNNETNGTDYDGDGYNNSVDCNDHDALVFQIIKAYFDSDGDNFGVGNILDVCSGNFLGGNYSTNDGDCDDSRSNVYPGAKEICDNDRDDDCDGKIDEACGGGDDDDDEEDDPVIYFSNVNSFNNTGSGVISLSEEMAVENNNWFFWAIVLIVLIIILLVAIVYVLLK